MSGFSALANVVDVNVTSSNGYTPNGSTEITVEVSFESATMEYADFISFSTTTSGASLNHSSVAGPSPYLGCGLDRGDLVSTGSLVGWSRPGFESGGSGCGAFRAGEVHSFPLVVTSSGSSSSAIVITVTVTGDGNGSASPSTEIQTVLIPVVDCIITSCPGDQSGIAGPDGLAEVTVPEIVLGGSCNQTVIDYSDFYPIGETVIEVVANDVPRVACSFSVIVEDNTPPSFTGFGNISRILASGECSTEIASPFTITDNGSDMLLSIAQNNTQEIDLGVSCPGGITRVYRAYDTDAYDINTELVIQSISYGVLESGAGQTVTATVYIVDGGFPGGSLTEVATGSVTTSNNAEYFSSIPVSATIPAGSTFVVELSTAGSLFGGAVFATSFDGESAPSYIQSPFCSFNDVTTFEAAGFPGQSLVMAVNGFETSAIIRQLDNTGYSFGDQFEIGSYTLQFEAIDASGNSTGPRNLSVVINEYANPTGSISCNDLVNISLDIDCSAVITADQVLEGDQYGCYDDFVVEIENAAGVKYGNTIDASMIGMTLKVRVTGPNGNSCWGNILIEDKGASILECQDVYTTCTGGLEPGDAIAERVTFLAEVPNATISNGAEATYDFDVPVFGLVGSTIADVNVVIDIDHARVSDLVAIVTAPNGMAVQLFTSPGDDCGSDGIRLTFDDEALATALALDDFCDPLEPSIQGAFQPASSLSLFDGQDPNGVWTINISDARSGEGGTVNALSIVFSQTGGSLVFPTTNPTTFVKTGVNQYTVDGIDGCGSVTAAYSDEIDEQPCSSPYREIITRIWNVEDEQGNQSGACSQTIYVFRNDLSTLEFPMHFDGVNGRPTLSCTQYGETIPDSTVTGYPTGDFCDNVQVFPYEDQIIPVCNKSYKIIRRWKLLEWCSGDVIEYNQIIKVEDVEGPRMTCPANVTMSTESLDCYAQHRAVAPTVTAECSDVITYSVSYLLPAFGGVPDETELYSNDNVRSLGSSFVIQELPVGTSRIKWTATDECGNSSECTYDVTVYDDAPPVTVCDEFTVTSIGSDGLAYVDAFSFDDLSIDNCSELTYEARKMTDICGVSGTTQFSEKVAFCCEEVGMQVMVEMRVTDANGNANTCMVEVRVEDKLPPYITQCPADITLDCQADFTDLSITGSPEGIDNCGFILEEPVDNVDIDQCGRGEVERVWTIVDGQGRKASCTQYITLQDSDPFSRSDIRFPSDYTAFTCNTNLDPDNLPTAFSAPRINDDICSLTAVDYKDQKFSFVDGSCEKILRTWTVIDWCTYDPNEILSSGLARGVYVDIQVIKLENTVGPTFVEDCESIDVCSYGSCGGPIELTRNATDDCTPSENLRWEWSLDIMADGIIDVRGTGNVVNISLNDGNHEITWLVEDKCGNTNVCKQPFRVKDCKKPTPYCRSSVTTVIMPSSGSVAIWASDFDLGSTDNCTPAEELRVSFSTNVNETSRTFTCAQIPDGQSMFIPLSMYVTDNEGNSDYCDVALILQDNSGDVCDSTGMGTFNVTGTILLNNGQTLQHAEITLTGEHNDDTQKALTASDGTYSFGNLSAGVDYSVAASKTDGLAEGVSTLDLVLIQRHIIAIAPFTDPYHLVAADIDDNDRVSGADVVALRKVILGINNFFPNGQDSWRFVDAASTLELSTALPYDEIIHIADIDRSQIRQDLVAVKIGDINNSYTSNLDRSGDLDSRSARQATISTDVMHATRGEEVIVPIYADDMSEIAGYQFGMSYDQDALGYLGYRSAQIDLDDQHIVHVDGQILTSWSTSTSVDITADEPLFYLVFAVQRDVAVHQAISLDETVLVPEAYDADLEVYDIGMTLRSDDLDAFVVEQNSPNPFNSVTTISFFTPEDTDVSFTVTDLAGRVVMTQQSAYTAGLHSIVVDADDLDASGVLFYTISTAQQSVTKRMIAIR